MGCDEDLGGGMAPDTLALVRPRACRPPGEKGGQRPSCRSTDPVGMRCSRAKAPRFGVACPEPHHQCGTALAVPFRYFFKEPWGGAFARGGQGRREPQPRARSVLWLTRLHLVPSVTCRAAGRGSFKERVPPPRDRAVPRPLTGRESTVTLPTTSVAVPRTCMSGARGRRYHGGLWA